jgi:two-component system, LytTR family, response regulator
MKAVIVDNELSSVGALNQALEKYCPEVSISGTWSNVVDSVKGILEQQPDLVFLDVELDNGATGFDVLEKIPDRNFEVIFVTAFDKYAVRAFHFSATHYLEKPIDGAMLREAVERVKKKRSDNEFRLQLQVLSESLKSITSLPKQIILPNPRQGDSIVVPVSDVIRVEASGSQAIFYIWLKGKIEKTMYSLNIGTLQKKMLQGYDDFIMIHESHIINRNHITHYNTKSHSVQMADETFIRVADRRLSDFLHKLNRL